MILIVCVDDHNGMMFNHRRQSQDRVLRADILELTDGKKIWMNAYSRNQFAESDAEKIRDASLKRKENMGMRRFSMLRGTGSSALWRMRMSPAVWSGSRRSISTVGTGIIPRRCIFQWISACGSAWRRKNLRDLPMRKLPESGIPVKI